MSSTRRRFMKNFGGAAILASPFLSFLNGSGRADGEHNAQRLVVFFSPNGSILPHWRPSGTESSFSFPEGSILEPLAEWKDRLLVIDGLDFKGATNHECCWRTVESRNHSQGCGRRGLLALIDFNVVFLDSQGIQQLGMYNPFFDFIAL